VRYLWRGAAFGWLGGRRRRRPDERDDVRPRPGRRRGVGAGTRGARAPAAQDHRPLRVRLPADVRSGARPDARLQRHHLQLPRAPKESGRQGLPLLLHLRHRGPPEGVPPVGDGFRRPPQGHVRLRHRRAGLGEGDPRPRQAGHKAAVPRRNRGRRPPLRLDAPGAPRGGRRGYLDRPACAPPLHDVPLRSARSRYHPQGREAPAAGDPARPGAGRLPRREAVLVAPVRPRPRPRGDGRARLGGRHPGGAARRRRAAHGLRRAGRGPPLRRPRLEHHRRAPRRDGPERLADLQRRLRVYRRHRGGRVRVLRPSREPLRHRPPQDAYLRRGDAAGAERRDPRDERADGQPRRRRLLPPLAGGGETCQGRAVRAGGRRGLRGLRLVPAAGGCERDRPEDLRGRVLRPPARRDDRGVEPRVPRGERREPGVRGRALRPARSGRAAGSRAQARQPGDAGGRPGEARRQHDDGLGPGSPRPLPRPRARRARRRLPAGAQARPGRQGSPEGGLPARHPERGNRPGEGLLPRPRAQAPRRAIPEDGPGGAPRPRRPREGHLQEGLRRTAPRRAKRREDPSREQQALADRAARAVATSPRAL
ncbi:MAG: Asparagine synthetase [glutamine-hydrolyzing], partial [uncultured Rubrobacteraceae bacterium]